MKKEYRHTGSQPILINGFGRRNPGSPAFICEMEPEQERFFSMIGAIEVIREVPEETPISPASKPGPLGSASPAPWPSEVNSDGVHNRNRSQ